MKKDALLNNNIIPQNNRRYIDVLLVLFIIIFAIVIRLPSMFIEAVPNASARLQFMTEEGLPYLFEMDSYHFAWLARSIAEGMPVDLADYPGLPLIGYAVWKIASLFGSISLYSVLVHIGPVLASLAAIPAYIFVRKRTGRLGAFTAGLMAALNAAFLLKSGFAIFDTDVLLCVLPLTVICCFVGAVESDRIWKCWFLGLVSALSFAYLTITWPWYKLYFYLVAGIWIALLILRLLLRNDYTKRAFLIGTILLLVYSMIVWLIHGFQLQAPVEYLKSFGNGGTINGITGFPSSRTYISELSKIPLFQGGLLDVTQYGIINRLGGIVIVAVSLIALIVMITGAVKMFVSLFRNNDESSADHINYMITTAAFSMWAIGGGIAPALGVRFVELTAIPLSVVVGLGIGYFGVTFKKIGLGFSSWVLALAVLIAPCWGAYRLASYPMSPVDDTLQEACAYIDEHTAEDSVIASWWDLGYYYRYEARRDVISHGATVDGRAFYWIGKALITDDEDLSAAIFRMLVSCDTQASQAADLLAGNPKDGSMLIEKLLKMEEADGRKYLTDTYSGENEDILNELADMLYPDYVPEVAVIITQDMLEKIEPISYYGLWDFSGKNLGVRSVTGEMLMYRLYTEANDMELFRHGKVFEDPVGMCGSNVWIIPALDNSE